jgi:hypothetical protein
LIHLHPDVFLSASPPALFFPIIVSMLLRSSAVSSESIEQIARGTNNRRYAGSHLRREQRVEEGDLLAILGVRVEEGESDVVSLESRLDTFSER